MTRFLFVLFCLLGGVACKVSSAPQSPAQAAETSAIKGTSNIASGSLAIIIINELNENLVARTDLKAAQAEKISIKAVGTLELKKLSLTASEGFENRVEDFAGTLVAGAIDALDEIEVLHQRQLNRVLEVVIESVIASLNGRTSHLEILALCELLTQISDSAIKSLKVAGFNIQSTAEGARSIVASAIGALDDAGILTEANGKAVVAAIVRGSVRGLKESPLADSKDRVNDFGKVLDDVMYGAVGSLDDAGFSLPEIDDTMKDVCRAGISELDGLGFVAADYEFLIEGLIEGALDGLKREAGVTDAKQIEAAVGFCVQGAVEGLADSKISLAEMDEIVAQVVEKSVVHIDNLGVSKENTETAVEDIVGKAVNGLIVAGFSKDRPEEFADVLADITLAAIIGLTDVGFKNADILLYLDDIVSAAYTPLKAHGFSKAQALVVGEQFRTVLAADLGASKESDLVIVPAELAAHVQSAIDAVFGAAS